MCKVDYVIYNNYTMERRSFEPLLDDILND